MGGGSKFWRGWLGAIFWIYYVVGLVSGVGLSIPASKSAQENPKCIMQYLYSNMLVTGSLQVEGPLEDQSLKLKITESNEASVAFSSSEIKGKMSFAFRTHHDGYVKYCFYNQLSEEKKKDYVEDVVKGLQLHVMMLIDTGEYGKLKPHETPKNSFEEIENRLERLSNQILDLEKNLLHIEKRENNVYHNVKHVMSIFKFLTGIFLLASGGILAWQYYELKRFFKIKKLL